MAVRAVVDVDEHEFVVTGFKLGFLFYNFLLKSVSNPFLPGARRGGGERAHAPKPCLRDWPTVSLDYRSLTDR